MKSEKKIDIVPIKNRKNFSQTNNFWSKMYKNKLFMAIIQFAFTFAKSLLMERWKLIQVKYTPTIYKSPKCDPLSDRTLKKSTARYWINIETFEVLR